MQTTMMCKLLILVSTRNHSEIVGENFRENTPLISKVFAHTYVIVCGGRTNKVRPRFANTITKLQTVGEVGEVGENRISPVFWCVGEVGESPYRTRPARTRVTTHTLRSVNGAVRQ